METLISLIVTFVKEFGYLGIFIMTFLESTVAPIPSEITMVPAGYLVSKGEMNAVIVLLCSIAGTVSGSTFSYWVALRYGRKLMLRYGKYFFMNEEHLVKVERYFKAHGTISILTARLIPGLRHFISLPAGLAQMDIKRFMLYTGIGGGLWMAILLLLGYVIGENEALLKEYLIWIKLGVVVGVGTVIACYVRAHRRKKTAPEKETVNS